MKKFIIIIFVSFTFCQVNAGTDGDNSLSDKNRPEKIKDCFEGLNRSIFTFNKGLDNVIFEPMAKVYRTLPSPIRSGTSNAINNLSNLLTIPNNILQGNLKEAGTNTMRLAVNTTVGVLGLFDVASSIGFSEYVKEDYGQTLASLGVSPGCYIVMPILGPSTLRDSVGSFASMGLELNPWHNITVQRDTHHFGDFDYYGSRATGALDFRAKNIESFENLEKNSMDFYASVKSLYLQDRSQKILNSKKSIQTQNDEDWEEIESK